MYHEPELQDEAALSAWIAIWSPRISRDADATRNLITQIFEMEDPDFLPYLLLLSGCLEDQSFSNHLPGAEDRMFLDALRTGVEKYRAEGKEYLAKIRHIERIMEDANSVPSH
jgi:hypothetical protein